MNVSVTQSLRAIGLTSRRVAAYTGTSITAHLPRAIARKQPSANHAALPIELWCLGTSQSASLVKYVLGEQWSNLKHLLADDESGSGEPTVRARHAIIPVSNDHDDGYICCDFPQHHDVEDDVCWPDDSSHHLLGALPTVAALGQCPAAISLQRWLDVGTGPALLPLHRRTLGCEIVATDINPRAIRYGQFGVALSGRSNIRCEIADGIPKQHGKFDLITFNSPLPAPVATCSWHFAPSSVLDRFVSDAPRYLSDDGTIVMHALVSLAHINDIAASNTAASMTFYSDEPHGVAVVWWRPHCPGSLRRNHRRLSLARPHIDHDDHPSWWRLEPSC
jgi:hypothetical protein